MDSKPAPRVKDAALLRQLHREWNECALCMAVGRLSLHHIRKRPRDDVRANLIMLCGDGVQGCHGRVEAREPAIMKQLGDHIRLQRHDFIEYLAADLGADGAREWILRQYRVAIL